ncbi:MAG: nuclear transport factor 2 family protein [Solirubrobacterales bacterium]|nr:nuclear transport factor 2 family protein [Solirubrobacterales bacterium]MBV9473101.1 nuclear transport factor 2 family protein [Solirubrobacterales bacterium]
MLTTIPPTLALPVAAALAAWAAARASSDFRRPFSCWSCAALSARERSSEIWRASSAERSAATWFRSASTCSVSLRSRTSSDASALASRATAARAVRVTVTTAASWRPTRCRKLTCSSRSLKPCDSRITVTRSGWLPS